MLRAWARSLPALRGRVADYLEEDAGSGEGVSTSDWTPDTMRAAVAAIRQETPDLAHNDVALMLCWLADYVPVPEDLAPGERLPGQVPRAEDEGPYHPRWEPLPEQTLPVPWADGVQHWQIIFREVLEGLRQLAADSAVWTAVNHFAESLRALIDEKARERASARAQLQEALDSLLREAGEDLTFFGLQDVPRWRPEQAPLERIPALLDSVADLERSLGRHHALRQMTAATVNEQLLQRMRLQSLESRVYETYARLASVLGARAAEAQTAEPEPAVAQPPEAPSAAPGFIVTEVAPPAEERPAARVEAAREGGSGACAEAGTPTGAATEDVSPARQVAEEGLVGGTSPWAEPSAPPPGEPSSTSGAVETVEPDGRGQVAEAAVLRASEPAAVEAARMEEGVPEPQAASAVAPTPQSASEAVSAAEAVGALAAEEAVPEGDLTSGSAPLAAATPSRMPAVRRPPPRWPSDAPRLRSPHQRLRPRLDPRCPLPGRSRPPRGRPPQRPTQWPPRPCRRRRVRRARRPPPGSPTWPSGSLCRAAGAVPLRRVLPPPGPGAGWGASSPEYGRLSPGGAPPASVIGRGGAPTMAHDATFGFPWPGSLVDGDLALDLVECLPGDPSKGRVPMLVFHMRRVADGATMGRLDLRLALTPALSQYGGHIAYRVEPAFRGHHYAARSVRLIMPRAREFGMGYLWSPAPRRTSPPAARASWPVAYWWTSCPPRRRNRGRARAHRVMPVLSASLPVGVGRLPGQIPHPGPYCAQPPSYLQGAC